MFGRQAGIVYAMMGCACSGVCRCVSVCLCMRACFCKCVYIHFKPSLVLLHRSETELQQYCFNTFEPHLSSRTLRTQKRTESDFCTSLEYSWSVSANANAFTCSHLIFVSYLVRLLVLNTCVYHVHRHIVVEHYINVTGQIKVYWIYRKRDTRFPERVRTWAHANFIYGAKLPFSDHQIRVLATTAANACAWDVINFERMSDTISGNCCCGVYVYLFV